MSIPPTSEGVPVDWSAYIKTAIIFAVMLVFVEIAIYAKSLTYLPIVIAGGFWLGWGIWIRVLTKRSHNWPTAQGIIIESAVDAIEAPLEKRAIYYFPHITYRYWVAGIEFVSSKIVHFPSDLHFFGGGAGSYSDPTNERHRFHLIAKTKAEEFCARFSLDEKVAVYYNSRSPNQAVLIIDGFPRSQQHSIVFIVLGGFLLSVGVLLFYVEILIR